jgi:hypothetical protein
MQQPSGVTPRQCDLCAAGLRQFGGSDSTRCGTAQWQFLRTSQHCIACTVSIAFSTGFTCTSSFITSAQAGAPMPTEFDFYRAHRRHSPDQTISVNKTCLRYAPALRINMLLKLNNTDDERHRGIFSRYYSSTGSMCVKKL